MNCDIIIPVWNQLALTKDCLSSIFANTGPGYGIIVVDNASAADTKNYLEATKSLSKAPFNIIRNEINLGFIKAVNQGIAASKARYVCLLNNDTIVTKGWLEAMIEVAESSPEIGIVNPSSNNLGQKPAQGEPIELYAEKLRNSTIKTAEIATAIGFCMLIKRAVIEKIGFFDEIYGMGNFEDTDFSRSAAKAGYRAVRAVRAYVYHRENSSFKRRKDYEISFNRNREIYESRWGKPKRIACVLDLHDSGALKRSGLDSIKLALEGNWVFYFFTGQPDLPEHPNITKVMLSGRRFRLNALFGILKKKKKFNEILVGDKKLGKLLEHLKFIHKAEIKYY